MVAPLGDYESWKDTCDTVHAHTQVLGKLCVALAPHEPQLQHAALRLTARGWETRPLPAPDGSGAVVAGLDLHRHEAFAEHSDGRTRARAADADRPVGEVTRELLQGASRLAGEIQINTTPQEVDWTAPLDEDTEHATYDEDAVASYFDAATRAALVLAAVPGALPRPQDPGERVVGLLRPRRQPVRRRRRRPALRRLHHAELDERAGRDGRLVAGRRTHPPAGVLLVRPPGAGGVRGRQARARCRPLARRHGPVPARLGGR